MKIISSDFLKLPFLKRLTAKMKEPVSHSRIRNPKGYIFEKQHLNIWREEGSGRSLAFL
jgi:hypothetical protein